MNLTRSALAQVRTAPPSIRSGHDGHRTVAWPRAAGHDARVRRGRPHHEGAGLQEDRGTAEQAAPLSGKGPSARLPRPAVIMLTRDARSPPRYGARKLRPSIRVRWRPRGGWAHSWRSAVAGSRFAASHTGTKAAVPAASASSDTATRRARRSIGQIPVKKPDKPQAALTAIATPTASPATTGARPRCRSQRRIAPRLAPRARRKPVSRVRALAR